MKNKKNNSKIVHIGYGRCSTTILQKKIFPIIAKEKKFNYWGSTYKLKSLCHTKLINKINKINKKMIVYDFSVNKNLNLKKEKNFFISCENLLSVYWDPFYYKKTCLFNKKVFGNNVHIIITIRKPSELLRSIYLGLISANIFLKPEEFFLNDKNYNKSKNFYKWNLSKFDYQKIINFYKKNFKKVTVVKYEKMSSLKFLKKVFLLNDNITKKLKYIYNNNKENKSYSSNSVKIAFSTNNVLKKFGFSLKAYDNLLSKLRFEHSDNILKKKFNSLIKELNFHHILTKRYEKLIYLKKFQLSKKFCLQIGMFKLDKKYQMLKY